MLSFLIAIYSTLIISCQQQEQEVINIENPVIANDTDAVLISINEKIKQNPDDPELYHQRARYFFETKKDINAAMDDMSRLFMIDSSKVDYFITLSDIYFVKGLAGNVKASLEKALELDPGNIAARMKLAELYLYLKNYHEAISNIDKVLKTDKYHAKAYFIKGMAFKEMGDTAKAASSFQTTVEQDPDYYDAYMQLGLLFAARKNKMALDYYNSALKINPRSIEAWYALGIFFQENGMHKKAIESYYNILDIDSDHVNAHYNLGYVHSEYLGDHKTAIIHYGNAILYKPSYFEAYYMRGYSYERLKEYEKALENYNQALKLNPEYSLAAKGKGRLVR